MDNTDIWEKDVFDFMLRSRPEMPDNIKSILLRDQERVKRILGPVKGSWWTTASRLTKFRMVLNWPFGVELRELGAESKAVRIILSDLARVTFTDREHRCPVCGAELPRDVNSAKLVKRLGTATACPPPDGGSSPAEPKPLPSLRGRASRSTEAGSPRALAVGGRHIRASPKIRERN